MTTSERLRELDGALHPDISAIAYPEKIVALRNALPLIADVVEAAELLHGPNCASWIQRRDAPNVIRQACNCKLGRALIALREALEEK